MPSIVKFGRALRTAIVRVRRAAASPPITLELHRTFYSQQYPRRLCTVNEKCIKAHGLHKLITHFQAALLAAMGVPPYVTKRYNLHYATAMRCLAARATSLRLTLPLLPLFTGAHRRRCSRRRSCFRSRRRCRCRSARPFYHLHCAVCVHLHLVITSGGTL
jgi:hypothetical protein